jgi:hypothetical protein
MEAKTFNISVVFIWQCYSQLQVLDAHVNKTFKDHIKSQKVNGYIQKSKYIINEQMLKIISLLLWKSYFYVMIFKYNIKHEFKTCYN